MKEQYLNELKQIQLDLNKLSKNVFRAEIRYQKIKNLAATRELELTLRAKKIEQLLCNSEKRTS